MIHIEIVAYGRMDARRADTAITNRLHFALHLVHVARRPAQIAYEALEVRHLSDLFDFVHDRLL